MDRDALIDLTYKQMSHDFGAAPSTCKKAREMALAGNVD